MWLLGSLFSRENAKIFAAPACLRLSGFHLPLEGTQFLIGLKGVQTWSIHKHSVGNFRVRLRKTTAQVRLRDRAAG
jgi:hypothetical protein